MKSDFSAALMKTLADTVIFSPENCRKKFGGVI